MTFDFGNHENMLSKHHRDSPPLTTASRWNLSKFVVIKHFGWESLNVQPSCCLDVVLYMLNCVFWRHIPLEIEFKSRVDMGSDSNHYTAQRYNPWAVAQLSTRKKKQKRGEFKTPPYPTGRRSNKTCLMFRNVCFFSLQYVQTKFNNSVGYCLLSWALRTFTAIMEKDVWKSRSGVIIPYLL